MKETIEQGVKLAESTGNTMQGIGRVALFGTVIVIAVAGFFIYQKVSDLTGLAVDAGKAAVEMGVDGAKEKIKNAGEGAKELRETTQEAVVTATEGVDTEALKDKAVTAGKTADGAVDKSLGWLQKRRDQLSNALDGDQDTSINSVQDPERDE